MRELREIRIRRGMSQADLYEKTGVSEFTISELEAGKRTNPRPSTLRKLAQGLGVEVTDLLGEPGLPKADAPQPEDGTRRGDQETAAREETLRTVEERPLRYLRVPQLFAAKQTKLWAARVERVDFGEEEFRKGVDAFLDFEGAFVQGVGTDLLAALREDPDALPKAEREALDAAKASIDAWHRVLWEASDMLKAAAAAQDAEAQDAPNVEYLDDHRKRLKQRARGEFARGVEADDGANVS